MDVVEKKESRQFDKTVGAELERIDRQAQISSKLEYEAAGISQFSKELMQLLITISSLIETGPAKLGSRSQRCRG